MIDFSEKTLILIKPDAMARNLAGEIITRLQRVGLRIVDCRIVQVDAKLAAAHYPVTDQWLEKVGNNTLDDYQKYGYDPKEIMGSDKAIEIGKMIHKFNQQFLMSGPVMALIMEGKHAIEVARKLVGSTNCVLAPSGTIRGDYSNDSALAANSEMRPISNLIHASGTLEEAKREIKLWFEQK